MRGLILSQVWKGTGTPALTLWKCLTHGEVKLSTFPCLLITQTIVLNEQLRDPHSHGFSDQGLKGQSLSLLVKSKVQSMLIVEIED